MYHGESQWKLEFWFQVANVGRSVIFWELVSLYSLSVFKINTFLFLLNFLELCDIV